MPALVDTNILFYRLDARDPGKQSRSRILLREGLVSGDLRVPYQALVELVAATTRPLGKGKPALLSRAEALREVDALRVQFDVLYPNEAVLALALRGALLYELAWFDACLWAYAEHYGLNTLYSADFTHGRMIGRVRVVNPFLPRAASR